MGRIALLGFLPVALLLGWDIYAHYQQAYTDATQKQLHNGEMAGERLQDSFRAAQALLGGIALEPKVRDGSPAVCSDYLAQVTTPRAFRYTLFARSDRRGIVDCASTGPQPTTVGVTPNIRDALQGHFGIGSVRKGPLSSQWIIPLSYPLRDAAGHITGAINTGLRVSWLMAQIKSVQSRQKERFWLLRGQQIILADPALAPLPSCRGGLPPSGTMKICRDPQGERHLLTVADVFTGPGAKLEIVIAEPLHQVLAGANTRAWMGAIAGAAILFFSWLLSMGFARRSLYRPLQRIQDFVERLSTGHYADRLPADFLAQAERNDIIRLGARINTLALNLDDSRQQLQEDHDLMAQMAMQDALTGLPNRRALDIEIEKAMARAIRRHTLLAVCMLDLDAFKPVNDTYGHDAGDQALCNIAQRLEEALRKTDFLARVGGDEFVLVLEDAQSIDDLLPIFDKIAECMTQPIALSDDTSVCVGISMGVAIYALEDEDGPDALLRYADHALYESKTHKAVRTRYWALYGENFPQYQTHYRHLLQQEAVEAHYQPILDSRQHRIVGVEALAHLREEDHLLQPAEFLPHLASEDIDHLCAQVLRTVLRDLPELDADGHTLWASFKVDSHSSFDARCRDDLREQIVHSGVDPRRLHLEILEGGDFSERRSTVSFLQSIRDLGVGVCLVLNDIGSAHSSLLQLKELPVDEIKLDQGFVYGLEERPEGLAFAMTIQDLAEELGLDLIVKGVETAAVQDALTVLGAKFLQGHAIAGPLPITTLRTFLAGFSGAPHQGPETMLGLYAEDMLHHKFWPQILAHDPNMVDAQHLSDPQRCGFQRALEQLGYSEGTELDILHREYHRILGITARAAMRDIDLQGLIAAGNALRKALSEKWRGLHCEAG
jgi:diguanylate cyclase (GGDEF)-like protein